MKHWLAKVSSADHVWERQKPKHLMTMPVSNSKLTNQPKNVFLLTSAFCRFDKYNLLLAPNLYSES